ncbi:alpha/beta hydrolase [Gordonia sp. HY002]|uniref:alpha/beta hydrolase family protein n=1 Tax=Gordonia zhenghanii TaxID=2911516 RepID=UPI001EEF9767|nr:alpha/beta hydrolase [Gordonia zhenghanii]MCF8571224.1 alpha/beta hydrolase [Gordonia zhenghanii]MCF8601748.1 alpha/beta hydrolase [Gordonia zhenghanii]
MSRRRRLTLVALGTVVALVLGVAVWILIAKDYAFHEERVTIPGPRGELHGVLAIPSDDGPHGLVVFVHDDGPADADDDGHYRPLWDAFAQAGFASLSWDKPGVADAPGDWLDQTMHDRATEVDSVIAWAHTRDDIDTTQVGAWGIGQAGWVLPEVAQARPDLRFMIAVDPAIDWLRREQYAARAEAVADGDSPEDVAAAVDRRARRTALIRRNADYRAYLDSHVDEDPMPAARWAFVKRNANSDSTAALKTIPVPTLLLLGGRDRGVDVAETERVYRRQVQPDLLTVKDFPDGTHRLTRNDIEYRGGDIRTLGRSILAPKTIYVPHYLDTLRVFAKRQTE